MGNGKDNKTPSKSSVLDWWRASRSKPAFWIVILAALALGFLMRGGSGSPPGDVTAAAGGEEGAAATMWTCSMHPQIQLPDPGQCPLCFMDLIPVMAGADEDEGPRVLSMSEASRKLAQVVTRPVERRFAEAKIQLVGKVDYDETSLAHITAWVPGRLDRLFVDYTGIEVRMGDHLVEIYSPKLLAAQEELLQALEADKQTEGSGLTAFRSSARAMVASARDKLRLWGVTDDQIAEIENRGTASDHVTIFSPIGGVVVHKDAIEGSYVQTGTRIYTIADLSHVWVELEAYESDLKWLRYGQAVSFEAQALPGEQFKGTITFIDPILDARTRTVRIRVNVPNGDRKLKPGMFVRATVTSDVTASGLVTDVSLAGKWICPMHPEVVRNHPDDCGVCGMPLVTTKSLGYVDVSKDKTEAPLVIPASAPLITGKRAVVYVQLPDRERPTYEGREVVLGPRAGDFYLVESGLEEGELVVVNGAFKIDSELQIRAGPSMMSPEGGAPPSHAHAGHGSGTSGPKESGKATPPEKLERLPGIPSEFREALLPVYAAYFELQGALAEDRRSEVLRSMARLSEVVEDIESGNLDDIARSAWRDLQSRMRDSYSSEIEDGDWVVLRTEFEEVSAAIIALEYMFGHPGSTEYFVAFCPMAFDNTGAYWLQDHEAIANPYFGQSMLKCGKVTDRITPSQSGDHE